MGTGRADAPPGRQLIQLFKNQGYYLAANLFLLCGSFLNFVIAIGLGSLIIFFLMNLMGYAGEKTGVPHPVRARRSALGEPTAVNLAPMLAQNLLNDW